MSKPKKPGTDLAALKARLAKKTKGADAPADVPPPGQVAEPAPAADVPPPGQVAQPPAPEVPPPGEVAAPPPAADVPPPGQAYQHEVPAPGQPMEAAPPPQPAPEPQYDAYQAAPVPEPAPMAAPAPAPAPMGDPDDPFGGGAPAVGFDPDAGLIDAGGDVAPRGSKGLVIFAALLAAGIGGVAGFLGNKIMGTQERVDAGTAKGAKMVEEVTAVSNIRKGIAVQWDDVKKTIASDPKAGAEKVTSLLTESFDKHPQVGALFGWQLASVHPVGVKKTFELYEETSRLKTDLGILAGFTASHADALKAAGGPTLFGVVFKSNGAVMVEAIQPLCGEAPKPAEGGEGGEGAEGGGGGDGKIDPAALKPCEDAGKAVAYKARTSVGAEAKESIVLRGYEKGQMQLLLPEGGIYNYAVGLEPNKNALKILDSLLTRVKERLDAMNKAEKIALKALENYADNPTVDGENPQPDPGGGDGGGEGG